MFCPYGLKTWRTGQAIAKAAKAKRYPVLSSPEHNRFSKTAPTSCTRTCSQELMATALFQEPNSSTFFCDCKITTFPISTIYPPIQLSTFNNGTYSLRSTSLKHVTIQQYHPFEFLSIILIQQVGDNLLKTNKIFTLYFWISQIFFIPLYL